LTIPRERIRRHAESERESAQRAPERKSGAFLLDDIIIHRYMKGRNNKTFGKERTRAVNVTSIGKYRRYIIHTQTFDINYVSRARAGGYKHHRRWKYQRT
jgi:hypothetical protein